MQFRVDTPEGKVIAAAFLDSYNQLVQAVHAYTPQSVEVGLGTGGKLGADGATKLPDDFSVADAQRKFADMGLYKSKVDGRSGPGTSTAISQLQKIRGLPITRQLDDATIGALKQ